MPATARRGLRSRSRRQGPLAQSRRRWIPPPPDRACRRPEHLGRVSTLPDRATPVIRADQADDLDRHGLRHLADGEYPPADGVGGRPSQRTAGQSTGGRRRARDSKSTRPAVHRQGLRCERKDPNAAKDDGRAGRAAGGGVGEVPAWRWARRPHSLIQRGRRTWPAGPGAGTRRSPWRGRRPATR
jgi:hypothetical protein